ncbi:rubredoxin [Acidovorax sp. NCPPB 2350]|nr:rubredoxin [Acidovorax sp. NCPPB 2350]
MKTHACLICGLLHDEAAGSPGHGIAPGTAWEAVHGDGPCPECGAGKSDFDRVEI